MLRLEYHVVASLNAFAVSIADEVIHQSLASQIFLQLGSIVERGKFFAVVVGVFETILGDGALGDTFCIIRCQCRCVFRYKIVGHNAATSIDNTSNAGLVLFSRLVDAVLAEEFSTFVACDEIHFIFFRLSFHVWFLDASARWGVIACDGEVDERAICKFNGLLHQSLSEGTSPHNDATVVVLNGPEKISEADAVVSSMSTMSGRS